MRIQSLFKLIVVFVFLIGVSSCARRSFIYSPSLNLGEKPMEKGQISVGLNGGLLPETSPNSSIGQRWIAPAGGVNVKLGLLDNLEFRAETWTDISTNDDFARGSSSFSLVYKVNENLNNWDFFVIPKYGFVNVFQLSTSSSDFSFLGIQGHGLSLSVAATMATKGKLKPYFGLSGLMGFADWQASNQINSDGNFRNRNGQALILHGGVNVKINEYMSFNGEIPVLFQFDQFNDKYYIFPTLNLGLNFSLGKLWNK